MIFMKKAYRSLLRTYLTSIFAFPCMDHRTSAFVVIVPDRTPLMVIEIEIAVSVQNTGQIEMFIK